MVDWDDWWWLGWLIGMIDGSWDGWWIHICNCLGLPTWNGWWLMVVAALMDSCMCLVSRWLVGNPKILSTSQTGTKELHPPKGKLFVGLTGSTANQSARFLHKMTLPTRYPFWRDEIRCVLNKASAPSCCCCCCCCCQYYRNSCLLLFLFLLLVLLSILSCFHCFFNDRGGAGALAVVVVAVLAVWYCWLFWQLLPPHKDAELSVMTSLFCFQLWIHYSVHCNIGDPVGFGLSSQVKMQTRRKPACLLMKAKQLSWWISST